MGTISSKFKKHLQNGDEFAAMQIYQSSSDLRRNIDPNFSYGDTHLHNTPMHYAAVHAMKPLLRAFLFDRNGNPNKKNGLNQTSLHLACQNSNPKSLTSHERRKACVALILHWRGTALKPASDEVKESEVFETIDMATVDDKGNTALHYAAASGLKRCVELLVQQGAPLFLENEDKETPCDLAEKNGHDDIMMYLESRIVFDTQISEQNELNEDDCFQESYCGLTSQELQEAKDVLLVETSDMLHIPLFSAEALLRTHEWSREVLLENWMKDPLLCCERARIQPPTSALQFSSLQTNVKKTKIPPPIITTAIVAQEYQLCQSLNSPIRTTAPEEEIVCEICFSTISTSESPVPLVCEHQFCRSCWQSYLEVNIQEGDAHNITCPAFQCSRLVPVDIIESLVTPEMVRRYLQFDIQAFVESNPQIKWCPFPGCGRAVRLPQIDTADPEVINMPNTTPPAETSHAVDCGNGHFFCWDCYGEAHAPCNCEKWKEWHIKISTVKAEELKSSGKASENAANCLWLVTNSKPCPNCKSPIQKNDGCNHMKCSKCKFDFCWVCLETWKKHNTVTGGYFRCNRFEAVNRAEEKSELLITEAASKNAEMQELSRFVHYYTRFKNHENSHKLEEPLLKSAVDKIKVLAAASTQSIMIENQQNLMYLARPLVKTSGCSCNQRRLLNNDGKNIGGKEASSQLSTDCSGKNKEYEDEIKFFGDAVKELLKARRVLCGSYVYGYYLVDNGYNKTLFEFMQNELEEFTEKLSEMIARSCLRTPKYRIIATAAAVKRKSFEFLTAVSKGLVPPETPPNVRKRKKRKIPGLMLIDPVEDLQITQAVENSLKDLDPENPWVKDTQGRHTNLLALYDWPDYDSDDDLQAHDTGTCKGTNCSKPRAKNPRTGEIHDYCSLRCYKGPHKAEDNQLASTFEFDYNMDLLIALEMSRLQMIEDMNKMKTAGAEATESNAKCEHQSSAVEDNTEENINASDKEMPGASYANDSNKYSETGFQSVSKSFRQAAHISLKDDCQIVSKRHSSCSVTRSASDGQLYTLRESLNDDFPTFNIDEPITSSSGDETDVYFSANNFLSSFLQNINVTKEIDERNFNPNSDYSKACKEMIFTPKSPDKPYEESSL